MTTFLEILQTAADELGLQRPTSVQSTDQQTRQLAALANRAGNELYKARDWTDLQSEFVIEFGAPVVLTGTATAGSKVVTGLSSTSALEGGYFAVSGEGAQIACRLATVDGATQVTLTESMDVSGPVEFTFTRDTFALPSDYDRYINQTQWDRRFQWALIGPTSPQMDEWQRSGIVTTGPRRRYRNIGRKPTQFRIWPPPSAQSDFPGTLAWEYISNLWVTKANGDFASSMTEDTDEPIFPDGLMVLSLKWRFFQIKGFDYGALFSEYQDWLDREKGRDGGHKPLRLAKTGPGFLITPAQVQDGNWPGPL